MSARIDIRLNRPQWEIHRRLKPGQTCVTPWGRGVGKSWFQRFEAWRLIAELDGVERVAAGGVRRGVRIPFLMPTLKQFKAIHGDAIQEELAGQWSFLGGKLDKSSWKITFPGGSWIQPFPAEAARSRSARGIRADFAIIDECDDVMRSVYDALVTPWFSEPWSMRMVLAGGTPRMGRYGLLYALHTRGLDVGFANHHTYHATWRDAPETVSREAALKAEREAQHRTVYLREWECDFDAGEGLVYDMFDEAIHVKDPPPGPFHKFIAGVDWGYTDPGVILVFGVRGHGQDATAYLIEEHYRTGEVIDQWAQTADQLRHKYPGIKFWCDPSQPQSIRSLGDSAFAANNKIDAGVARVASMLFVHQHETLAPWSRLYISPSAINTRRELVEYRRKRDPRDSERFLEEIEDKNNHCFVAGTPVLTGRGDVPIEGVTTDDVVLTRDGWAPVKASGMTNPRAETWSLDLSNGQRIEATPDHLVWTVDRGFIRLDSLRYGDKLLPCETSMGEASLLSSRGSDSEGTLSHPIAPCASTGRRSGAGGSIVRSTRARWGRYPKGITFTTKTATRSTTRSPTSSASAHRTTSESTCRTNALAERGRLSTGSGRSPQRGTEALKAAPGTSSTREERTPDANPLIACVSGAASRSGPRRSGTESGSAATTASQQLAVHPESISLSESAPTAASPSASTSTAERHAVHVLAVAPTGKRAPVYDLTIDGRPEFFAGGVLVHNSMDAARYALVSEFGLPSFDRQERQAS